ncbi:hypothetical protein KC347_g161 [Hortaea werneckii]|nr:hypothetical protein KC347_g161 [Hortaea werneckii]
MSSEITSGASVVVERPGTPVLAAHRFARASLDSVRTPLVQLALSGSAIQKIQVTLDSPHLASLTQPSPEPSRPVLTKLSSGVSTAPNPIGGGGSWFEAGVISAFCKSSADKRINLIEGLRSWVKSNSKLLLHYAEQASVEWRISALQDQEDADNFDSNVFNTLCKAA